VTADLLERLSRDGPAWLLLVVAIGAITYLYKGTDCRLERDRRHAKRVLWHDP
jgi:hypothetical protein